AKPDPISDVKPDPKPEVKPDPKPDPQPGDVPEFLVSRGPEKDPPDNLNLPAPPQLPDDKNRPLLSLDPGGHTSEVRATLLTPDGSQAITCSIDKSIRVWDAHTGEMLRLLYPPCGPGNEGEIMTAALSPNGKLLAVANFPIGSGAHGILLYLI